MLGNNRSIDLRLEGRTMFSHQLRKHVQIVLFALVGLALTAGNSSAVVINFVEQADGSIHVTTTGGVPLDLDVTKPAAEFFRISAPNCTGCGEDATLNQIGT